ncbi:MAG: HNH endonuclease signature motif containing protein [Nanoarchaeota archaeon]
MNCKKCKQNKSPQDFHKNKRTKNGLQSNCKICVSEYMRAYCLTPEYKERDRAYRKIYNKTPERREYFKLFARKKYKLPEVRERIKKFHSSPKRKKWQSEYRKQKLLTDPKFHLTRTVAKAIWYTLQGRKKNRKWQVLTGYTIKELMNHLEKQFDDKMKWDNYGKYWHIDHIRPISSFDYKNMTDENFKKCWALENLQPLEAKENMKKSDNYFQP